MAYIDIRQFNKSMALYYPSAFRCQTGQTRAVANVILAVWVQNSSLLVMDRAGCVLTKCSMGVVVYFLFYVYRLVPVTLFSSKSHNTVVGLLY